MEFLEWCLTHKIEVIIIAVAILAFLISLTCLILCLHKYKKGLFKFRRYKKYEGPAGNKHQHPKLIVEITEEEYGFMGLTESKKHGKTTNLPIKNPEKGNNGESYIRKEVRHASKGDFFDEILRDYKLTRKDKKKIIKYLENRKKK